MTRIERKTKTDGKIREFYNSLFTELQELRNRLNHWELQIQEGGAIRRATDLEKMNILLSYTQIEENRKHTKWFIILTIVNILVLLMSTFINYYGI